jgi:hypothetical protein
MTSERSSSSTIMVGWVAAFLQKKPPCLDPVGSCWQQLCSVSDTSGVGSDNDKTKSLIKKLPKHAPELHIYLHILPRKGLPRQV